MSVEWPIVALRELVEPARGISYGIVQPGHPVPGGVPIVRVSDVRNGRIATTSPLRVANSIEKAYARTRLCGGELLISIVGTVGETAIVPQELAGWNVARAIAVLPVKADVGAYWVKLALRSPTASARIQSRLNTTVQATLNLGDLAELPILLPPPRDRERIGKILGALDDKIALNRRMNETLEAMARAVFKDWFVDFGPTRAKMEGRPPYLAPEVWALFPERLDGNEKSEGWIASQVGSVCELNPAERLASGIPAPYLEMSALPTEGSVHDEPVHRNFSAGTKFRDGDTLLARITPCLENGKTAFVRGLGTDVVGWGSTEFIVIRPKPPLPREFGYLLARDPAFRDHAVQSMTGTSGRQRVQTDRLAQYAFVVPSKAVANAFGRITADWFDLIAINVDESRSLASLRDLLLPKLMSGEIRIKEAEKAVAELV